MQDNQEARTGNRSRRRKRRNSGRPPETARRHPPSERPVRGPSGRDSRRLALPAEEPGTFRVLYLFPEGNRPPAWSEVERALWGLETIRLEEGSEAAGLPRFRYFNPDTRVEAFFCGYVPEEPDEVGLAFEMPQPRPDHFAHEALPLAVQVARELRLDVLPPTPEVEGEPLLPTKEALLEAWQHRNTRARALRARDQGPSPTCRGDLLELSWEYLTLREDLERRYGRRGVTVPGIEYVQRRKTGEVLRLCRWTGLSPSVFPPVDLVYLENPPEPLKTGRILSADDLSEVARRWVKDNAQPIFHRLYLESTPPEGFVELLAGLKSTTMRSYVPVAVEDLEDV